MRSKGFGAGVPLTFAFLMSAYPQTVKKMFTTKNIILLEFLYCHVKQYP